MTHSNLVYFFTFSNKLNHTFDFISYNDKKAETIWFESNSAIQGQKTAYQSN